MASENGNGNGGAQGQVAAAREKAALARDQLTVGVADAVDSGLEAARTAKAVLDQKLDGLIDSGKDVIDQAEELIRTRPWASFGAAFAAGYLIAKLTRSKD
jgi:ElaB/YqjD/DUF883 family membrane-anchored ribosome-binding protein